MMMVMETFESISKLHRLKSASPKTRETIDFFKIRTFHYNYATKRVFETVVMFYDTVSGLIIENLIEWNCVDIVENKSDIIVIICIFFLYV